MIDRFGKEVDFSELFMEETLSAKDKKELPDSMYGLVYTDEKGNKVRKFPLNDEKHVRQAAIFFDRAKDLTEEQKKELARNIIRRAKELNMDYSGWESLKPYLDKPVKESDDKRVNDKGETVPEKCDKCGSPIKVFLRGEPVYLCCNKDCRKYFGTVPCDIQEQYMTFEWLDKHFPNSDDSTTGTSDFDEHDDDPDDCFTESFEKMFGPVIQEAFDAITGEEIPINHAYTMEEMAKRSLSLDEAKAIEKDELIPIKPPKADEVYFGSPTNHMPEIDLNRPLFVSPYKGIASIFIWGDMGLQNRIPRGSYNHNYEEWISFDEKKMKNPLKEVHVYVEGAPFLEPFTVEQEGYIHCISTKDYLNNFFRKPWMTKDLEYLIAKTDNMKVEFTRSIKCKVKYYIKGRPSPKGKQYGPSKGGILEYIHKIAKNIHAKYKADQKEPTGNQNCLLCTWCAEAQMRGQDYLPRPIYSPRDSALEITPGDIVGGVTKKNPGSFNDMLNIIKKESSKQQFARWYCHVKWGHSNGGHEFLIVKIDDNSFAIMDAQQGVVRPLTADDSYMKNIDWEGTYICRIDDKPFKYMKFDKINDPKKTLPWDPKKDIPYMLREGMITKDEAETELKRAETNEFYKVLKEKLGQTPVQEGVFDSLMRKDENRSSPHSLLIDGISREEFDKVHGENHNFDEIFSLYENALFIAAISNFNKAPVERHYSKTFAKVAERIYDKADADKYGAIIEGFVNDIISPTNLYTFQNKSSFGIVFAEAGGYSNDVFIVSGKDGKVYYMLCDDPEYLVSGDIKTFLKSFDTTIFNGCLEQHVQESAIGEILNGVNPFSNKRVFHISQDGHLDGQVFKPRVPEYLDKYDPSQDKFEDVENPRVCFSPSIEGCLNAIMVTIGRWKTAEKLREWYVYVPEKPLKEYKHHTNKQLVKEKKVYDANVTDEIWIEEPVRLKQYGIIRIDQVSSKSIKDTVPTTKGFTGHRYKYSFKWHWLVKPKVIADLPYDYSPKEVCKDMIADMEKFKYGLAENGHVHSASAHDYDTKYKLQSPEEFEQNGGGICYDYVEFMEGYLGAYGYTCRKFYISTDTEDMDTHTFLLVGDGRGWKDGFIYPESSFKPMEGVYEVKSPEEAALKVMDHIFDINDNDKKYDEIKYYVWEYKGHPPYGSDMETCHKYFTKGDPIHEGTAKKIKRKD